MDIQELIDYKDREIETYQEAIKNALALHADYVGSLERELNRSQLQKLQLERMR